MIDFCGCVSRQAGWLSHEQSPSTAMSLPKPFSTATRLAGTAQLPSRAESSGGSASVLRIVVISDTHGAHDKLELPPGDVLLHCGDCFKGIAPFRNDDKALKNFFAWLNAQPHSVKIFIGGNHDAILERQEKDEIQSMAAPAMYLREESAIIEPVGLRVFGSPRSVPNSWMSPNKAYQANVGSWDHSPVPPEFPPASTSDVKHSSSPLSVRLEPTCAGPVDILLTHQGFEPEEEQHNAQLLRYIEAVEPRCFHCGGHAHGGHGMYWLPPTEHGHLRLPNALRKESREPSHTAGTTSSALLSLNAAIKLKKFFFRSSLQPPLVVDLEL